MKNIPIVIFEDDYFRLLLVSDLIKLNKWEKLSRITPLTELQEISEEYKDSALVFHTESLAIKMATAFLVLSEDNVIVHIGQEKDIPTDGSICFVDRLRALVIE